LSQLDDTINNAEYAAPIYRASRTETESALVDKRRLAEPAIKYARTSDGVNIAYYSIGAHNRAEATAYAFRHDLVPSP